MTDIVERLRDRAKFDTPVDPYKLLSEAADFIESLRSRAEKAEAERDDWKFQFEVQKEINGVLQHLVDLGNAAEDTCEKLAAAIERYVASVNGGPAVDAPDDEWKAYDIEKEQAFDALRAALSAYRNVTTVNASGPKGETPETCWAGGADAGN